MIFANKCALDLEQIKCAAKDGFKYLEFHTELSHFEYSTQEIFEIRKLLDEYNITCVAIHMPIINHKKYVDYLSTPAYTMEQRVSLIETAKKAIDYLTILSRHSRPTLVLHIGTSCIHEDNMWKSLSKEFILDKLKETKEDLEHLNDYITTVDSTMQIVVENMPPFVRNEKTGEITNWYFGTNKDLTEFIYDLGLSNVRTCLDICHAETTVRMHNLQNPLERISIEDFISGYKNTIGHIHLNNITALGDVKKYHSCKFGDNKEDREYLYRILKSIKNNNIRCSITLEINEDDYTKRLNIKETKKVLGDVIKKI